ncbi:HesA/MoeB/ThiF family protein [Natranaerobius thermophilus]|nr:molybdopterin-synthase adenylyltransferase MoeB [Natranaerobius thermophilus]
MNFNEAQLERYSRQIILSEVGVEGQQKLLDSKVLIIGTGGLGAPAAMYLAALGIGTIGLVDGDKVELSNLQRQIIHQTKDIGKLKAESGKETILHMNPDVEVIPHNTWINSQNIQDIIEDYDFVIDGTDNFAAKFLINDACVMSEKPFCHAGIIRFQGQVMTYVPNGNGVTPCYRCVFNEPPPDGVVPSCQEAGVLGLLGGVIGGLQATEAVKYLLGIGDNLTGELLVYDALKMDFRKIELHSDRDCKICGTNPEIKDLVDYTGPKCNLQTK